MSSKIIIADDSQTTQKIIKITLANEDVELIECLNEKDLLNLVNEHNPVLVLLDFNFSEFKTGYDIAKELKENKVPKIFMLYASCDPVDEQLLDKCGVNAFDEKPLDGTKLIKNCRQLIEDFEMESDDSEDSFSELKVKEDDIEVEEEDENQWVVNQPSVDSSEDLEVQELEVEKTKNDLEVSMEDWGFDIPSKIGVEDDNSAIELPPVIAGTETVRTESTEEEQLPVSEDLEYPDVESIKSSIELEIESTDKAPTSQLVSITELSEEQAKEDQYLSTGEGTETEEEIQNLVAQIEDENESENFWTADEVEETDEQEFSSDSSSEIESPLQKVSSTDETNPSIDISALSEEEILEKMSPMIEKIVEKRVNEIIEKIAWDVIPDLAENLISSELKKISNEILSKNN